MPISPYFNPGYLTPEQIAMAGVGPNMEALGSQIYMGPGGSQSYDRFKAEYQARTGDPLADPFAGLGDPNVARAYNQAAANQWTQSRQLLAGRVPTVAGPEVLGPQPQQATTQATPAGAAAVARAAGSPLATLQPNINPSAAVNQEAYFYRNPDEKYRGVMVDPRVQALTRSLKVPELLPEEAAFYGSMTGEMPKPARYSSTVNRDPLSPNYGIDERVLNDRTFRDMYAQNPQLAESAYEALTRTPLSAALASQKAIRTSQKEARSTIIKGLLPDLYFDEASNQYVRKQRVRKAKDRFDFSQGPTEFEEHIIPLSDMEKDVIRSGDFELETGMPLRSREFGPGPVGGAGMPSAMTPELAAKLQDPAVRKAFEHSAGKGGTVEQRIRHAELTAKAGPIGQDFVAMLQAAKDEFVYPGALSKPGLPRSLNSPKALGNFLLDMHKTSGNIALGAAKGMFTGAAPRELGYQFMESINKVRDPEKRAEAIAFLERVNQMMDNQRY